MNGETSACVCIAFLQFMHVATDRLTHVFCLDSIKQQIRHFESEWQIRNANIVHLHAFISIETLLAVSFEQQFLVRLTFATIYGNRTQIFGGYFFGCFLFCFVFLQAKVILFLFWFWQVACLLNGTTRLNE